jgi:hypothetical protein
MLSNCKILSFILSTAKFYHFINKWMRFALALRRQKRKRWTLNWPPSPFAALCLFFFP